MPLENERGDAFHPGQIVTITHGSNPAWNGVQGVITVIHDESAPNGIPDDGPIEISFSQQTCPDWMHGLFDEQKPLTQCFLPYELTI